MFQKQDPMRIVSYSLLPMLLMGVYLYGWRPVAILAVVLPIAIICEFIFENQRKKKVTEAVFVTSLLYALSMPPGVPLWVAGVGIAFGVIVGKELYGGFGRNIYNPAIVGRVFVYCSFSVMLQTPLIIPGGFGLGGMSYSAASYTSTIPETIFMLVLWWGMMFVITKGTTPEKPMAFVTPLIGGIVLTVVGYVAMISIGVNDQHLMGLLTPTDVPRIPDATTAATPLVKFKMGQSVEQVGMLNLLLGIRTGMVGEGCTLLLLIAFVYLVSPMAKGVVNYTSALSTFAGALVLFAGLYYSGAAANKLPAFNPAGKDMIGQLSDIFGYLMSGSLIFICVYMVTDPVTSPNKNGSRMLIGAIIGASTILIRMYSAFPEGVSFAILIGNTFAPLSDKFMPKDTPKKKPTPAGGAAKPAGATATPKPQAPKTDAPKKEDK